MPTRPSRAASDTDSSGSGVDSIDRILSGVKAGRRIERDEERRAHNGHPWRRVTGTVDEEFTDVLSALTHEVRIDILRVLADADGPVQFTELRSRVGTSDPGRFNCHLGELCGQFVRRGEGGYTLTYRGKQVVAGTSGVHVADDATDEDDARPVRGESDCDRLVHVHLSPGRRSGDASREPLIGRHVTRATDRATRHASR